MASRPVVFAVLALALAGCSCAGAGGGASLRVELATDLVAGGEYLYVRTRVETLQGESASEVERRFGDGAVFAEPRVVAELADLAPGRYTVEVALLDPSRAEVAMRRTIADVRGSRRVTVLVTRSCRGVACGDGQACHGGTCRPLECDADPSAPGCAPAACASDDDCGTSTTQCLEPRCVLGACLDVAEHRRCTRGLVCSPEGECGPDEYLSTIDPTMPPDAGLADASGLPCEVARIDMQGRIDIAARVAMERFEPGIVEVVIANATNPGGDHLQSAEALVAGPVARAFGAPLLLVAESALLSSTREALEYLAPSRAIVVGPVDPAILDRLTEMGMTVDPIAGADRFETAALVARAVLDETGAGEVVVASGADAHLDETLAASAAAADLELPLLFVDGETVPAATAAVIDELSIGWIALIGGTHAVPSAAEAQLAARASVTRYGGATPAETAVAVVRGLFSRPAPEALLVRGPGPAHEGATYGMGLTALAAPILFTATDGSGLDPVTRELLAEGGIESITIVGNTIAVGARVEEEVCAWLAR